MKKPLKLPLLKTSYYLGVNHQSCPIADGVSMGRLKFGILGNCCGCET